MASRLEKISAALDKTLSARGLGGRLKEYRIFGKWEKIVGGVIASHARPVSLRGKKLFVAVDSSAWMQQLTMLKPAIIEKANNAIGKGAIGDIALRLGEVSPPAKTPRERPAQGSLDEEERKRIDEYAKTIKDADIREFLRRVMEKDFLNKKRGKR